MERKNAGEIISEVLAWRGLLIMPLALVFMFLPFVEIFFKVDLIKARYTAPELDNLDFSLWTDIKRRFARTCDLHPEKVLNAALEKIDDELDLVQILRKQAMMKRGVSELDALEKRKDIFDCEFESNANAGLLLIDEEPIGTKVMDNEQQFDLSEEEDSSPLKETMSALVKVLDENETEVVVLANGGKGYGSLWNMGTLCVLSTGLIVGLLLLGLLDVDNQFVTQTCLPSSEEEKTITIPKERFMFRIVYEYYNYDPNRFNFVGDVIDEDNNVLRNLTILKGSNCSDSDTFWFCLS